jgi:D-glycero-D-manno-heptose 1,7-bisphosphate phosphatase
MSSPDSARSAVFLDRDGVLNELTMDPRSGRSESPLCPEDVRLLPGIAKGVRRLREAGYLLIGVTNQPAAAKGTVSEDEILAVHAQVVSLLAKAGIVLDAWRLCLHHPEGTIGGLGRACDCRKPAPGMLFDAAQALAVDLRTSWMIGDTDADIEAGRAAGCRTILVEHLASAHKRAGTSTPDQTASDLASAADVIVSAVPRSA